MLTGWGYTKGKKLDSCSVRFNSTGLSILQQEIEIAVEIGMAVGCDHVL